MTDGAHEDTIYNYDKYIGNGMVSAVYTWQHVDASVNWTYSYAGMQYGSVMADLDIPITSFVSGYVRYFHGYGESLIDYNHFSNTLSAGIVLDTW